MLINIENTKKTLDQIRNGTIKEGLKLDIPEIDNYIRFKPTNFNVILGHANVGKTTMILFLMLLYTRKHGIKWLIFSSENESHSIVRKLLEFLALKPLEKIESDEYDKHIDFINTHFKIVDTSSLYTYKKLIELGQSIKDAWNYQGFLIDPYNSLIKDHELMKGVGSHEYDYQATSEFRLFCMKNNVTIWLNTHANTTALRVKHPIGHEMAGHPIPPLASDVEEEANLSTDPRIFGLYTGICNPLTIGSTHIYTCEKSRRLKPEDGPHRLTIRLNSQAFRTMLDLRSTEKN